MNKRKEIKIESSPDEMFRVEQFVEEICDEYLLYGSLFGCILMAVTEGVQNAIVHGNGSDRQKHVRVVMESTKEGLWIRVSDEGKGFDHALYSQNKDFKKEFGTEKNGLLLIHKLADEVRFQNNGRIIKMLFHITGIDDDIFDRRRTLMQEFFRVYKILNT